MADTALNTQVGGDHYKRWPLQPVEFSVKIGLCPIQAAIVKYITRHSDKGGAEDLYKSIHYFEILRELLMNTPNLGLNYPNSVEPPRLVPNNITPDLYCRVNNLPDLESQAIKIICRIYRFPIVGRMGIDEALAEATGLVEKIIKRDYGTN